jgi:ribose transport system ATP-binding protein
MAAAGKALLVVSSDLRELMAMSDRIGVMSGGRLVALFKRGEWTQQGLLEAAFSETGGDRGAPGAAPSPPASVAAN